jgi:hypothetical protein
MGVLLPDADLSLSILPGYPFWGCQLAIGDLVCTGLPVGRCRWKKLGVSSGVDLLFTHCLYKFYFSFNKWYFLRYTYSTENWGYVYLCSIMYIPMRSVRVIQRKHAPFIGFSTLFPDFELIPVLGLQL